MLPGLTMREELQTRSDSLLTTKKDLCPLHMLALRFLL